ncbi:MAG TPA: DUF2269 family protein [Actinomycetota bacterium]
MSWRTFFLFLHILAAIIAFGPTFAFGILGAMGAKEPMHGNFALRVSKVIGNRLVDPFAFAVGAIGVVLIFVGEWDLFANEWLLVAIALYLFALAFSLFVQDRWLKEMIRLSGGQEGTMPQAEDLARIPALARKAQAGGMLLALLLVAILLMMVWKPGACAGTGC